MSTSYGPNHHQDAQDPGQFSSQYSGPSQYDGPPQHSAAVLYNGPPQRQGQHYAQAVYVQTDNGNNTSLAPVTSLVAGLIGAFLAWIPIVGMIAWVLGPIAIVFGILGLQRGKPEHKIMSIFGIVAGGIALAVCVGYVLVFAVVTSG